MLTKSYLRGLSYKIIGCAIEVNKQLGPGLLESVYHACMMHELKQQGLEFKSQLYIPVLYKEQDLGGMLKIDLLVENEIIIELKSVETMIPLYNSQLLTYLQLANKSKGLLINFNCEIVKKQITSMVTENYRLLPE